jgi:hypothetical protein
LFVRERGANVEQSPVSPLVVLEKQTQQFTCNHGNPPSEFYRTAPILIRISHENSAEVQ